MVYDRVLGFKCCVAHNGWMLDGDRMMISFYDHSGAQIGKVRIYPLERRDVPKGAKWFRLW